MLSFLRRRSSGQRVALVVVLVAVACLVAAVVVTSRQSHPAAAPPQATASAPPIVVGSSTSTATLTSTPSVALPALPRTTSADVYAKAVATALWNVDYASTTRDELMTLLRGALSTRLPLGSPAGTTLAQAQNAAISTINGYVASDAVWANLATGRTSSRFTVTGVTEPGSWVAAVSSGQISDPGLTARTVTGVQTFTYAGAAKPTTQTQEVTIAMLCPPTTTDCSIEILPPRDTSGTAR